MADKRGTEPGNANAILYNESVHQAIALQRYGNSEVHRMIALLNRSDAQLLDAIESAVKRGASTEALARLTDILHSVRAINSAAYGQVSREFTKDLAEFSEYEANREVSLIKLALPNEARAMIDMHGVSATQVHAAAMSRPFQGRLLSEWFDGMDAGRATRIRDAIRIGMVNGDSTDTIVRQIRGTRANKYADGLLERPRQDLRTVVQTAIAHTAQSAREETAQANADILKAVRWVSTLDNRTTQLCRVRDAHTYSLDKHRPLDGGAPWGAGPGRLHFNCRSVSTYVLKSWQALGLKGLKPGTRASMDGQVPAEMNYAEWLATQPVDRVIDILGPTRAELYMKGGLKLDQFSNDRGVMYTLDQLRQRDADAFRKAGLD